MSLQTIVTGRVVPPADVLGPATGKERPTLLSLREQTVPGDPVSARADAVRVTLENVTASETAAVDLDEALRTAQFIRKRILDHVPASISAIANPSARSVLSLLG